MKKTILSLLIATPIAFLGFHSYQPNNDQYIYKVTEVSNTFHYVSGEAVTKKSKNNEGVFLDINERNKHVVGTLKKDDKIEIVWGKNNSVLGVKKLK